MPLFACRFHLYSFPSVPFGFPRGPFSPPMQSAHITSRTAETEISSAWQYRRNAEDFHSRAAKMTPIGEPAAALNAFKVHLFASVWPNSVSMRRTELNEQLGRSKRVAPAPLLRSSGVTACTAQQCGVAPAQAQVRTSRLPCGLCFLLASLMWRESKPPSRDSIQTAQCRPGGNIWASRFMPMASLWTRRRNTDDTSMAAWTCGWFIASDSFASCGTHSSVSKTFASAGPPVARSAPRACP